MLKNYLKIAYRNLLKNKVFNMINILGLAIGMVACLLILQYVRFEMSYDDFHENADDIYRVSMDRYVNGEFKFKSARTYPALAPRLKEDFPEVIEYVRLMPDHGILANEARDLRFYEDKIFLADASFFEVFSYRLNKGNPAHVLQAPNALVLSATMASKYFGEEEAIGKTLSFYKDDGTQEIYKVTGVFEDVPPNSHLRFDILMAYNTLQQRYGSHRTDWKPSEDSWEVDEYYTYVLLDNDALPGNLEEKLPDFFIHYKGKLFEARNVQEVHRTKHQRNRYPQGVGRFRFQYTDIAFPGLCEIDDRGQSDCFATHLFYHAGMVGELRLPYRHRMVAIGRTYGWSTIDHFADYLFSSDKSSLGQPGQIITI